jgi:hypothetical protein
MADLGLRELLMVNVPQYPGYTHQLVTDLISRLADEVVRHSLLHSTVVSIGEYGHVRLHESTSRAGEGVLLVLDVADDACDANGFLGRFMALVGFDKLETGAPWDALQCLNAALMLQPEDPILLHARGVTKRDVVTALVGKGGRVEITEPSNQVTALILGAIGDLLRSIELTPHSPGAYADLQSTLESLKPAEVDQREEHRRWVREVVGLALSHPTDDPYAVAARRALQHLAIDAT